MIFKRYCVTVNDNWTSMRTFWTLEGAKGFYRQRRTSANVFGWENGKWDWFCGARDLVPVAPVERLVEEGDRLRDMVKALLPEPAKELGDLETITLTLYVGEIREVLKVARGGGGG